MFDYNNNNCLDIEAYTDVRNKKVYERGSERENVMKKKFEGVCVYVCVRERWI